MGGPDLQGRPRRTTVGSDHAHDHHHRLHLGPADRDRGRHLRLRDVDHDYQLRQQGPAHHRQHHRGRARLVHPRAGGHHQLRRGTGDVTGTTSTAGSTAATYDSWGRQLTYSNTPSGQPADSSTTTYNPLGQVVSVVDNNGQTAYTYDGADANGQPEYRGLVTAVKTKLTGGTEYTSTAAYDHAGALTLEKLPGKIIRRTSYDTAGNQTGYGYNGQQLSSGQFVDDQPWLAWTTIYTPLGQVNRDMTPGGAGYGTALGATASALNRSFGYDRAGRLTFAKERYGNGTLIGAEPGCSTRTYTFDANGNRTGQNALPPDANGNCVTTGGNPVTRAYDSADRPTTGANGAGTYTYDQLGRQTLIPAADAPKPADGDISLGY